MNDDGFRRIRGAIHVFAEAQAVTPVPGNHFHFGNARADPICRRGVLADLIFHHAIVFRIHDIQVGRVIVKPHQINPFRIAQRERPRRGLRHAGLKRIRAELRHELEMEILRVDILAGHAAHVAEDLNPVVKRIRHEQVHIFRIRVLIHRHAVRIIKFSRAVGFILEFILPFPRSILRHLAAPIAAPPVAENRVAAPPADFVGVGRRGFRRAADGDVDAHRTNRRGRAHVARHAGRVHEDLHAVVAGIGHENIDRPAVLRVEIIAVGVNIARVFEARASRVAKRRLSSSKPQCPRTVAGTLAHGGIIPIPRIRFRRHGVQIRADIAPAPLNEFQIFRRPLCRRRDRRVVNARHRNAERLIFYGLWNFRHAQHPTRPVAGINVHRHVFIPVIQHFRGAAWRHRDVNIGSHAAIRAGRVIARRVKVAQALRARRKGDVRRIPNIRIRRFRLPCAVKTAVRLHDFRARAGAVAFVQDKDHAGHAVVFMRLEIEPHVDIGWGGGLLSGANVVG